MEYEVSFPQHSCHAERTPHFPFAKLCLLHGRLEHPHSDTFWGGGARVQSTASDFNCTIYRNYYPIFGLCAIYIHPEFMKHQHYIQPLTKHKKLVYALRNLFQSNSSWLNHCQALNFEQTAVERR